MRHRYKGKQLNRNTDERKRLIRFLIQSFIKHGKITSTRARVQVLQREVDRLVTLAKKGTSPALRRVTQVIDDKHLVHQFITSVAASFGGRQSGFTRRILLEPRRKDAAEMARLEWVMSASGDNDRQTRKQKKKVKEVEKKIVKKSD